MADVFISYAKQTKPHAERIARALAADGYSVWWDEELPIHVPYAQAIQEQVTAAKAVVVV
jgi:hypothetical protein